MDSILIQKGITNRSNRSAPVKSTGSEPVLYRRVRVVEGPCQLGWFKVLFTERLFISPEVRPIGTIRHLGIPHLGVCRCVHTACRYGIVRVLLL